MRGAGLWHSMEMAFEDPHCNPGIIGFRELNATTQNGHRRERCQSETMTQ
jgi:hypothetical protein